MRGSFIAVALSFLLGLANAAPSPRFFTGCDVSGASIPLAPTTLTAPVGKTLKYVALGVGTQNYSCSATGIYASIGALATLYDASCFVDLIEAAEAGKSSPALFVAAALSNGPLVLGKHYFINNPTGAAGVSPTFDFRADSQKGNPNAYVVLSKSGDVPSPDTPTTNVDWLELTALPNQGSLASNVFRITTIGGQPPTSCTSGSAPITVNYAATYWFFN